MFIPEIHALSIAFFLLDFAVNKPPFYKTQTENIALNTSEVIFHRMFLNIRHIKNVSSNSCRPYWLIYYPLSYGVPVRERYGSTLLSATREQHDQNCTQSH